MKRLIFTFLAIALFVTCAPAQDQRAKVFPHGIKLLGTTIVTEIGALDRLLLTNANGDVVLISRADAAATFGGGGLWGGIEGTMSDQLDLQAGLDKKAGIITESPLQGFELSAGTSAALDAVTYPPGAVVVEIETDPAEGSDGYVTSGAMSGTDLILTMNGLSPVTVDLATLAGDAGSIADNTVTDAKLTDMPDGTIKGRNGGTTGDPENLTATEVREILGLMVTESVYVPTITDSDYNIIENNSHYYRIGNMCTVVIDMRIEEVAGNLDSQGSFSITLPFSFRNQAPLPSANFTGAFPCYVQYLDQYYGPANPQTSLIAPAAGTFLIGDGGGSNIVRLAAANFFPETELLTGTTSFFDLQNIKQDEFYGYFTVSASFTYLAN